MDYRTNKQDLRVVSVHENSPEGLPKYAMLSLHFIPADGIHILIDTSYMQAHSEVCTLRNEVVIAHENSPEICSVKLYTSSIHILISSDP